MATSTPTVDLTTTAQFPIEISGDTSLVPVSPAIYVSSPLGPGKIPKEIQLGSPTTHCCYHILHLIFLSVNLHKKAVTRHEKNGRLLYSIFINYQFPINDYLLYVNKDPEVLESEGIRMPESTILRTEFIRNFIKNQYYSSPKLTHNE